MYIVPAAAGISYADCETMVRIGADLPLNANSGVKPAGEWNAEQNCIDVNGQRNDVIWAALRLGVKRVMYVNANSSTMRNALDLSALGTKDQLNVTIGVATKATVAVDAEAFGSSDVTYTLTGELPSGVTFNTFTGAFSGTPVENGTYPLVISLAADGGWVKASMDRMCTRTTRTSARLPSP